MPYLGIAGVGIGSTVFHATMKNYTQWCKFKTSYSPNRTPWAASILCGLSIHNAEFRLSNTALCSIPSIRFQLSAWTDRPFLVTCF
jgi:hypothetical protein